MAEVSNSIVVGLDGSEPARRALAYAIDMAAEYGSKLVVATIVDWHAGMLFPEAAPVVPALDAEWFERAERDMMASADHRFLDPARAQAEAAGIPVETRVAFGSPAQEMADLAKVFRARALVVGRSGSHGLRRPIFGGVASALLSLSEAPVFVVP